MTQDILNFETALELGRVSNGFVFMAKKPDIRQGKRSRFMTGLFRNIDASVDFRAWDEATFLPYANLEPGVYYVRVQGGEYRDQKYLTLLSLEVRPTELNQYDFVPSISREATTNRFNSICEHLRSLGASQTCFDLANTLLNAPELGGRFFIEGAAVTYHDNRFGGLYFHTTKMLAVLAALADDQPHMQENIDLLTLGIILHDIGKVFEYSDLQRSADAFAHHRIRGIEFLAAHKAEIEQAYSLMFYRHLQAIISGHHGEYGDRPTTMATYLIHLIDTIESQVTGLLQDYDPKFCASVMTKEFGTLEGFSTK